LHSNIEPSNFEPKVVKEQVNVLYLQALASNYTIIGIAWLFFVMMQGHLDPKLMASWAISLSFLALYRLYLYHSWKKKPDKFSSQRWLFRYIIASGLVGLGWSGLYLFEYSNDDLLVRSAIFMLFFAILGAAVSILSISLSAFILYSLPQVLTLAIVLLLHHERIFSLLVLGLAIYYVMMIIFARNSNRTLLKSIKLQIQNATLINQLNQEIDQREDLVTERTKELALANQTIINSELRLQNVIAGADLGFWDWDYQTGHHEVSKRWLSILGLKQADIVDQVTDWSARIHDDDKQRVEQTVAEAIRNLTSYRVEFRMRHQEGHWVWIEGSGAVVEYDSDNDKPIRLCGTHQDITLRKQSEQQLQEHHHFIQNVIDGVNDEVMVINQDYTIPLMNKAAKASIDQQFIKDIEHPKCFEILHHQNVPCHTKGHACPLREVIAKGEVLSVIHNHLTVSGINKSVELTATPLKNNQGDVYAIIESAHDITSLLNTQNNLKEHVEALDHLAHHDVLTKLPNRLLFIDRLRQAIKKSQRNQRKIAVLFIDLDHFKEINDTLGHRIGDQVLSVVSDRLKSCIRVTDTVARLGGDEFTIIIDAINDTNMVTDISNNINQQISQSIPIEKNNLQVTSSIGISIYPNHGDNADTLLRNADAAMYKAKEMGRNTYRYYTDDMTLQAYEHVLLESNLRQALEQKQLVVHYQPQVSIITSKITSIEALVRWQHPEQDLILPKKFIPLAQDSGLIIPLGEQVMDMAIKQMVIWRKQHNTQARLAINLSVKELQEKDIVTKIANILRLNACKSEWLELEVMEDYIMQNSTQAIETLQKFKNMGVEVSIDDFGTGYSSLSYLKRLPIDKLKIGQSFIRDINSDESDQAIVAAIISMAKSMKLTVVAEGVETQAQQNFIQEQGCEMFQGYLYSKPLPSDAMTQLLRDNRTSF